MSIRTLRQWDSCQQQRSLRRTEPLSGVSWWTWSGKSLSHSEQIIHFRGSCRNQKLKQVINILARLPRRRLMLISFSQLCFLFSWHSLIFHNAGNSTLIGQNSPKLSNEFHLPVYLAFQLASLPQTFQVISKPGLKHSVSNSHPTPTLWDCASPKTPHSLWYEGHPWSAGSREADVIRRVSSPSGDQQWLTFCYA